MYKVKFAFTMLTAFALSLNSANAQWTVIDTNTTYGEIQRISISVSSVRASASGFDQPNPGNCTNVSLYHLDDSGNSNFDAMVSALLTAKTTRTPVQFYVDGCAGDFPKVVNIVLE